MSFREKSLDAFTAELASGAPVPGGGGASALAGALAADLASMVTNLTIGKKRYQQYETELEEIRKEAEDLRTELLRLMDADAEAFLPLSKAYAIPKDAENRERIMDEALLKACEPPLAIMEACCRVIRLGERLTEIGSKIALSDVGVCAAFAWAALRSASYNVFINAKSLSCREDGETLNQKAEAMLKEYLPRAEAALETVERGIR